MRLHAIVKVIYTVEALLRWVTFKAHNQNNPFKFRTAAPAMSPLSFPQACIGSSVFISVTSLFIAPLLTSFRFCGSVGPHVINGILIPTDTYSSLLEGCLQ